MNPANQVVDARQRQINIKRVPWNVYVDPTGGKLHNSVPDLERLKQNLAERMHIAHSEDRLWE